MTEDYRDGFSCLQCRHVVPRRLLSCVDGAKREKFLTKHYLHRSGQILINMCIGSKK